MLNVPGSHFPPGTDAGVLAEHLGLTNFDPDDLQYLTKPVDQWDPVDVRRLTVHLLLRLNERLRRILGEDHELGHALFWEVATEADREQTAATLAAEFEEKVIGRLRQTLRDKDEQLVLLRDGVPIVNFEAKYRDYEQNHRR